MNDDQLPTAQINPWVPMGKPIGVKHVGEMLEELGEAIAAAREIHDSGPGGPP
jgi:hypothetical protein